MWVTSVWIAHTYTYFTDTLIAECAVSRTQILASFFSQAKSALAIQWHCSTSVISGAGPDPNCGKLANVLLLVDRLSYHPATHSLSQQIQHCSKVVLSDMAWR